MPISLCEKTKTFYLNGKDYTYAFCVSKFGFLNHLYYGAKIPCDDLTYTVRPEARGHCTNLPEGDRADSMEYYMNECPSYGRSDYRESMLAFEFSAGERVTELVYENHRIVGKKPPLAGLPSVRGGETLIVRLTDRLHKISVDLYYTVFEELPVLLRHAEIVNCGEESAYIERAYSFCVDFPSAAGYEVVCFYGAHCRERMIERLSVGHGVRVFDSKRGVSSAQMNPAIIVAEKNTDENSGAAYGVNLVYSGDFAIKTERGQFEQLRVTGGINEHDFRWKLCGGETFVTPEAVLAYSARGLGALSAAYHDLYRNYLITQRFAFSPRPIVVNNWEATYFNFTAEKLKELIDAAAGTGIDTFVLDDGWFGERNDDSAGLGDYSENLKKLPRGVREISDYAHKKGLKFGLWIEPEMVNENSDLFRAHPDYIISANGLPPCKGRNQYVLDLSRKDVREYIAENVIAAIKRNNADYVKWDMNRSLTDLYSSELKERSKELKHRYVLGLYDLSERITQALPNVFFEGCASGGCRFDAGMLAYFPQIWASDDTDAYMRALIEYGTSFFYPPSAMSCHISACPNHQVGRNTPLAARQDIASLGATGYELDVTKLCEEELRGIGRFVKGYRADEELILAGNFYRLRSPFEENLFAVEFAAKNGKRAVITVMRPLNIPIMGQKYIFVQGLRDEEKYVVRETGLAVCGSTLRLAGLPVSLPDGDFQTCMYHIDSIEEKEK